MPDQLRLVVAGYGMVAHRFLEALAARGVLDAARVSVLAEECRPAYDRVSLSRLAAGGDPEELALPGTAGTHPAVGVHLGEAVVALDRPARRVRTATGRTVDYDLLVLATGSYPLVPPVPGLTGPGRFTYRTVEDLQALLAEASGAQAAVVVGGGLLGLEAAGVLLGAGVATTVVEAAGWLLPQQVDAGGGEMLRLRLAERGLTPLAGVGVGEVRSGPDGRPVAVVLSDGREVAADLVVVAAGVRPRDELARGADLPLGPRGGVLVDDRCATADPAVAAIGECAAPGGRWVGLVAPGYAMAEVLADRLAGGGACLPEPDTSTSLKLVGVDVASFGDAFAATPGALELVFADPVTRRYVKLVTTDDGRHLLGGILVGDTSAYPRLRPLVGSGLALPEHLETLVLSGEAETVELTEQAQVCTCRAVTRGQLAAAVAAGADCVAAVRAATGAGGGCGSCVPLVTRLVRADLARGGIAVSSALCEHFPQSRQELYQIVRVTGIRTFSELIARHGSGRGCDICKPAIASILATVAPTHVLDGEAAALQDTNDHVMANLQRNGTYSVVPRLPGGEVTPAALIAIGEVARDFGLYTKITGAQRVDLFGARLDQLPAIWRRLVDAGLESGHAYGKALRTVKSCVGSTWCRYGVQDSTSLAIALELRYRGLRAPHKIKAGVSGCARECAEAQSKDFGVIATESGWNLYLGGNGGFRPRHGQLFLTDVDTETLTRCIDRFLMLYIRTADRLQRTADWLEHYEGGLERLREVIVDDALGICADLDADLARHVQGYSDEWADTLADPDRLRRFVTFVNAPGLPDPTIEFVTERGQIRPARPGDPTTTPRVSR